MSAPSTQLTRITTIKPKFRAMARLVAAGASGPELSERFGLSPTRISQIVNSPLFKAEVERLNNIIEEHMLDPVAELNALQGRAIEVISETLENPKPTRERTRTAFDVLDRTGLGKQKDAAMDNRSITIVYNTPKPGDDPDVVDVPEVEVLS